MRLTREKASRQPPWKPLWILSLILLLLQLSSCAVTKTEDDNTTNTFVTVVRMAGESATDTGSDEGDDVFSDVCVEDLQQPGICFAVNDNGIVEMQAQPKDLTQPASLVQDVVFTRYRVTYVRADGRNVPGVDVPYPFDGAANFRVPIGTAVTRAFMVVRQQAKLESPLIELIGGGGSQVISTIAQIDFFGADIAGRQVQVTGFLNITFGDF